MSLILESKNKVAELSEEFIKELCFGYSCDSDSVTKINKILNYLKVLEEDEKAKSLGFTSCITPEAYECLEEQLRSIIGFPKSKCSDVEVDESNLDNWEMKNPYCVSYECWNKWSRITARDLELNVSVETTKNDLVVELASEVITPDVILCASVVCEANKLDYKVTRTIEESKLDYNLLLEKIDCDLTLDAYLDLIDNKFTYDIIRTIYENNLSIEVNAEKDNKQIQIKSSISKYDLKELDINLKLVQDKFGYSTTIKKTDLLTDFNC